MGCGGLCGRWDPGGPVVASQDGDSSSGVSMSFDRLAPHYRWLEIVLAGEKLQHCRTAFLSQIRDAHDVLILGEGNGRFLLECRKTLSSAQITCVDSSR